MSPTKWILTIAFAITAIAGTFSGLYECGAYIWVRQTAFAIFLGLDSLLLITFIAIKSRSNGSLPKTILLTQSLSFTIAICIVFLFFQACGQIVYLPPDSVGELLNEVLTNSLGCS